MIRVLIADDHAVVAEGLRRLLSEQPDISVIACVGNGREAVRFAVDESPDVVLMDNAMPELNGIDAAVIDLDVLKKAGVIDVFAEQAKVVLSGELKKAVTLKGIGATKGARAAIEAAGGKFQE